MPSMPSMVSSLSMPGLSVKLSEFSDPFVFAVSVDGNVPGVRWL